MQIRILGNETTRERSNMQGLIDNIISGVTSLGTLPVSILRFAAKFMLLLSLFQGKESEILRICCSSDSEL
jgi:hypothetical protein